MKKSQYHANTKRSDKNNKMNNYIGTYIITETRI